MDDDEEDNGGMDDVGEGAADVTCVGLELRRCNKLEGCCRRVAAGTAGLLIGTPVESAILLRSESGSCNESAAGIGIGPCGESSRCGVGNDPNKSGVMAIVLDEEVGVGDEMDAPVDSE